MTIEELTEKLHICYCKELCYPKIRIDWNENNKCFGMCAITALIVNDYFGGDICKMYVNGISHYFNLIDGKVIDLTSQQFENKIKYINYKIIKRNNILTEDTKYRYNILKNKLQSINTFNVKELLKIDNDKMFLPYTNIFNLDNISKKGLQTNIGINAKVIKKTKKVFFFIGGNGILVIMYSWLKWLVAKSKNNFIYWIGEYLLRFRFFLSLFIRLLYQSMKKININWAYKELNKMLNNSIYLVLD